MEGGWPPLRPWGWLGHTQTGLRAGQPPPMGWFSHPRWGGSATPFFFLHPQTGRRAGQPPLSFFFFFIFVFLNKRGWLRPWGWLAGLGVAEPPPWPKGWPTTPYGVVRLPLSFFFFFFSFFLKKKKQGVADGWFGHPCYLLFFLKINIYIYIYIYRFNF
jgi:hypothetical protein